MSLGAQPVTSPWITGREGLRKRLWSTVSVEKMKQSHCQRTELIQRQHSVTSETSFMDFPKHLTAVLNCSEL